MFEIKVPSFINKMISLFYSFGLWQNETTKYRIIGRKLMFVIFILGFPITLFGGALQSNDKYERLFLGLGGIIVSVCVLKSYYAYSASKKSEILKFLSDFCEHSLSNQVECDQINKTIKKFKYFSIFTISVTMVAVTINQSLAFSSNNLSLNIWFPFDWRKNKFCFWLASAYLLTSLTYCVLSFVFTTLLWFLMFNCSVKYKLLGNRFRKLEASKETTSKIKISEVEIMKELVDCIKTHWRIQSNVERFRSCFSTMFFVQITTSGISICISVFLLSFDRSNHFFQLIIYCCCVLYNLFDIFMIMYLANDVKLTSSQLSYCLFESNWIDKSAPYRKCIIILMEVLKKPHELVVGIIYPLNLETFMSILNGAYSMFNILQNL